MKFMFLIFWILFFGCTNQKDDDTFDCYVDAINGLNQTKFVDTLYISTNFPNFKIDEGKIPKRVFEFGFLNVDASKYIEIIPDSNFWLFHLTEKIKRVKKIKSERLVHFARFNYSFDMPFGNSPNFQRTYIACSPIYYYSKDNNGFFIISEINNIEIVNTKVFYICKNKKKYEITSQVSVHRFMPYDY